MSQAMNWLKANAPGFDNLSQAEQDAIIDFSLLWGLFEGRILNTNATARAICAAVDTWHATGALQPETYAPELAYFRDRYYPNGQFSSLRWIAAPTSRPPTSGPKRT